MRSSQQAGEAVLDRAFRLLDILGASNTPLGLSEISVRAGIPKATTFRLLKQMTSLGAIERRGEWYMLGHHLFRLRRRAQEVHPVHRDRQRRSRAAAGAGEGARLRARTRGVGARCVLRSRTDRAGGHRADWRHLGIGAHREASHWSSCEYRAVIRSSLTWLNHLAEDTGGSCGAHTAHTIFPVRPSAVWQPHRALRVSTSSNPRPVSAYGPAS